MSDDEIAERIAKHLRLVIAAGNERVPESLRTGVINFMDDAEAYHLAHVDGVRERAAVRRQAKRVRARVFEKLGLADRKEAAR